MHSKSMKTNEIRWNRKKRKRWGRVGWSWGHGPRAAMWLLTSYPIPTTLLPYYNITLLPDDPTTLLPARLAPDSASNFCGHHKDGKRKQGREKRKEKQEKERKDTSRKGNPKVKKREERKAREGRKRRKIRQVRTEGKDENKEGKERRKGKKEKK